MERKKILLVRWQLLVLVGVSLRYGVSYALQNLPLPPPTHWPQDAGCLIRLPCSSGRLYRQLPAVQASELLCPLGADVGPLGCLPGLQSTVASHVGTKETS